jgi:membrane protein DedA with SNARE-associated domain
MFEVGPESFAAMSGWVLFLTIFLLPFWQEDLAVIGAATASIAGAAPTEYIVPTIMAGLVASDAWKYWLGRLARRCQWAHRFAEKPGVSIAGDLIRKEFMQTMLTARFVPGTRIPTYVAAGFFKADYLRYVLTLIFTAALYVSIVFVLFHALGAVAGEQAKVWLPIGAVGLLVAYVVFRWLNHVAKHEGPMTPLTKEFDHPIEGPGFEGAPYETEEKDEDQERRRDAAE